MVPQGAPWAFALVTTLMALLAKARPSRSSMMTTTVSPAIAFA